MNEIFFNRTLNFREIFEWIFPYPDNIMPQLIYRKSMSETPPEAYAKDGAKAKSFIPKYGETRALALAVNFAINI